MAVLYAAELSQLFLYIIEVKLLESVLRADPLDSAAVENKEPCIQPLYKIPGIRT